MPITGLVRSMSSNPDALNQARRVRPQSRASRTPRVLRAKESVMASTPTTQKAHSITGAPASEAGRARLDAPLHHQYRLRAVGRSQAACILDPPNFLRRVRRMSTWCRKLLLHLAWISPALLMAGCVPIPYAYPTVSQVAAVKLGPERDEVQVFRVDIADDQSCVDFADKQRDHYVLSEVAASPAGEVPSQTRVAFDSGWYWNLIAISYQVHTHRTICVRLYRPGYRTVELTPGDKPEKVVWREARELVAQEKAVDDLLATNSTNS